MHLQCEFRFLPWNVKLAFCGKNPPMNRKLVSVLSGELHSCVPLHLAAAQHHVT